MHECHLSEQKRSKKDAPTSPKSRNNRKKKDTFEPECAMQKRCPFTSHYNLRDNWSNRGQKETLTLTPYTDRQGSQARTQSMSSRGVPFVISSCCDMLSAVLLFLVRQPKLTKKTSRRCAPLNCRFYTIQVVDIAIKAVIGGGFSIPRMQGMKTVHGRKAAPV